MRVLEILDESTPSDIRCRLTTRQIPEGPQSGSGFKALSYCWGDPTPIAQININGSLFGVARGLLTFLQCEIEWPKGQFPRTEDGLHIWIDAICINQADDEEKSIQVHQMWRIYTGANIVVAWLGRSDDQMRTAFDALALGDFDRCNDSSQKTREAGEAVAALSQHEYFSRMWIVPEIICGGERMILQTDGGKIAPFASLLPFSTSTRTSSQAYGYASPEAANFSAFNPDDEDESHSETSSAEIAHLSEYTETLLYARKKSFEEPSTASLGTRANIDRFGNALLDYRDMQCFDPRDRLFALLGLPEARRADPNGLFKPDYSMTLDEVAVAALCYFDQLDSSANDGSTSVYGWFVVSDCLKVNMCCAEFRLWLQGRLCRDEARNTDVIRVSSGRLIDCSGPILQRVLQGRPFLLVPDAEAPPCGYGPIPDGVDLKYSSAFPLGIDPSEAHLLA